MNYRNCLWQYVENNVWVFGEPVRGIVRKWHARVWRTTTDPGWSWQASTDRWKKQGSADILTQAIEQCEEALEVTAESVKAMVRADIATKLARQFVWVIRNALDDAKLEEIDRLNAAEENPNICHTHDFLDANMCMADAWHSVIGADFNAGEYNERVLFNLAWGMAKKSGFSRLPAAIE